MFLSYPNNWTVCCTRKVYMQDTFCEIVVADLLFVCFFVLQNQTIFGGVVWLYNHDHGECYSGIFCWLWLHAKGEKSEKKKSPKIWHDLGTELHAFGIKDHQVLCIGQEMTTIIFYWLFSCSGFSQIGRWVIHCILPFDRLLHTWKVFFLACRLCPFIKPWF